MNPHALPAALLVLSTLLACEAPGGRGESAREPGAGPGAGAGDALSDLLEGAPLQPAQEFDEEAYYTELAELYAAAGEQDPGEGLPPVPERELSPYQEFGKRIIWYEESGFIMKRYSFPTNMGQKAQRLLQVHGGFKVHAAPVDKVGMPAADDPQPPDSVVLHLLKGAEKEAFSPPRGPEGMGGLASPQAMSLGDWLLVTAQPAELRRVEQFIETFLADVRQIEIEAKIVEVVTSSSLDVGIRPIDDTTPIFGLPNSGSLINSIDYSFPNTADSSEAIFGLRAVFDGVQVNALLELVAKEESVSIISRPKVAVREGARAEIVNIRQIPYFNIPTINANGTFTTNLEFRPVGVQMYIVPRVIGTKTVILNIDIEASQQVGISVALAQGTGDQAAVVLVPQISLAKAHTTVRLEPGQAVILGGVITERTQVRESKIPFFGDIPLLGNLFKSRFTETERVNVLFFIRPRILQGIDLNPDF